MSVASKIEAKLGDKKFLGGDKPSAEDVKLFNEMLGENNTHLHRWVKHMASFTEPERSSWKAVKPAEGGFKCSVAGDAKAAGEKPVAAAKKAARTAVEAKITLKAGKGAKEVEELIKMIKVDGLDMGTFKGAEKELKWSCTIDDMKVSKQDLLDMTVGFVDYVEKTDFTSWTNI
eukprot:TRINITY_DN9518_c0_g1_i1.p2 TRINITY_DN9518_c0_g1~~TRINITY_DN9518_c0_g1_i1.p2  ORF type:complete len:174 (+),score=81.49 TRINITY_DN9518_c0_g1_i1:55-576(+)